MIESVEMIIRQPGFPDRVVALHEGATRIGRSEDNEVVLSDVGVSRRHSQVYWSGSECLIEDLGSGNGTYHHGQRVQSQALKDGDEVVLDPFTIVFRIRGGSGQPPISPPQQAQADQGTGARLEVIVGTGMAGSSYPITERGLSIGRAEDRDIVIPDPASSRHHCQISNQGERYFLRDMGSANGVYVNSIRVREQPLEDGDVVRIGNTEMRFVRYHSTQTDMTTQVTALAPPLPSPVVSHAVTHQAQRPLRPVKRGSSIWLWVTAFATLAAMGMLLVVSAVLTFYIMAWEGAPPTLPARATSWTLTLPNGLEGGTTESMFKSGVEKMKSEDHLSALQDFYRVLLADPGSRNAKKFALAAGEVVVLDQLEGWLVEQARAKKDHSARRDALLGRIRRGGRIGRTAEASLLEEFREDPVAIKEMGWEPTDTMKKRAEAVKKAAQALGSEEYAEAITQYSIVLASSQDVNERVQALAGLKTCKRELARTVSPAWRVGALQTGLGNPDVAARAFNAVLATDPTNACATLKPR